MFDEISMQELPQEQELPQIKDNPYKVNLVTSRLAQQKTAENLKFLESITGRPLNL